MPRKLQVVPADAVAPPRSVKDAADLSRREFLVALRTRIATDIDAGVPPHALAPLSRQIQEVDREIRAIDSAENKDDGVSQAAETPDADWTAV